MTSLRSPSKIEWTDYTWNFVVGCDPVTKGCDHCYAKALHDRQHHRWLASGDVAVPKQYREPFEHVQVIESRLLDPVRRQAPSRYFVNSVSDLFHKDVPEEILVQAFAVMATTPRHTYQILTKRPQRMRGLLSSSVFREAVWEQVLFDRRTDRRRNAPDAPWHWEWPLPNVWMGVSIEDQDVMHRAQVLVATPAAVRFVSAEPLLGPLDFTVSCLRSGVRGLYDLLGGTFVVEAGDWVGTLAQTQRGLTALDWIIVGGESGYGHRPIDPAWVRSIRQQCDDADVAFFFKQWGGATSKAGGRLLDGREYSAMPRPVEASL